MKKFIIGLLMTTPLITVAQKKENGTIYREHPAINVVDDFTKAIVEGDTIKIGGFLTDTFRQYQTVTATPYDKGLNKSAFLKNLKAWRESLDYVSISTAKGTYPDALEYTDPNQKNVIWVQTWDVLKGVDKETGVKVDMFLQRLFSVDKKTNKINLEFISSDPTVSDEIQASKSIRTNGTIYNHHPYINDVRNMLHAFENNDFDKSFGYYAPDARFLDINSMDGKSISFEELKANDKQILDAFEIVGLEQVGYPDYMHYEISNSDVVYSWWRWHLIRKSDRKEITLPIHYEHDFNKEGKIFREIAYYNASLLK